MSKRYPGGIIRKTPQTPSQTSAQGIWDMASVTQAVKENTWPIAGVPDPISKSLRFRSSASAYMNRTFTSSGNTQKFTQSIWCKRGTLGAFQTIGYTFFTGTYNGQMRFNSNDTLDIYVYYDGSSYTGQLSTTQVFRDPSAWYHFVLAVDTTQATSSNRIKFYVNGVQVTAFGTANYPNQNQALVWNASGNTGYFINAQQGNQNFFDGYITELNYIDGQQLTPSSFGNTNDQTGVWQPIAYTGTYGTNGFYLPFSNTASTTTLGYDFSGNSNNWTTNNISLTTGTSIQTFSTTGTTSWTAPTGVTSVNYLVVGGGGSGGAGNGGGGGGGAGGLLTGTLSVTPGTSYTVTVGAGGTGTGAIPYRNSGGNSVFGSITATGGGGGGYDGTYPPLTGGSGGGGNYSSTAGAAGTSGQGFAGGDNTGTSPAFGGGGGGGSSAVGAVGTSSVGGNGGAGTASSISGSSVTYAGGGGGGTNSGQTVGTGAAGGGNGGTNSGTGGNATANTGSGGGGGGGGSAAGGNGGSGIVILSWTSGATTTYDSMNDVPTQWIPYNTAGDTGALFRGNYATLNPLFSYTGLMPTSGNLSYIANSGNWRTSTSTISVTSEKWYCEFLVSGLSGGGTAFGIVGSTDGPTIQAIISTDNTVIGRAGQVGYAYLESGNKYTGGSSASYGASYTSNDVIGVALDLDAGTLVFYKNGVSQGTAFSSLSGTFAFACSVYSTVTVFANFGQRPFSYTPPAGFKTLCTTNLPTPTIGATASTTANKYFDATLYTGNNSTNNIVNSGSMQPDMLWIKGRSQSSNHTIQDSVRGVNRYLLPNLTGSEGTDGCVTAFNSNGFSLTTDAGVSFNANGTTYVGWQWRASNATAVTNTAGSITSTVSANTTAGFSIVTYTGTGSNATVGHGLGVTPSMYIVKRRSNTGNWYVYSISTGNTNRLRLDETSASTAESAAWNNTSPTSTVFSIGTSVDVNASGNTYVAYCFAPIAGYSAFGSYTGNGSSDGPFVFTGFRPRFILTKATSFSTASTVWTIWDTTRSPYNAAVLELYPNSSSAESTDSSGIDILSNGFKPRRNSEYANSNGQTYIYMAVAESPFKFSLAR